MKIAVLISGGVDSSVALRLLKDEGHDLTAFYLKIWLEDELSYLGECPWEEDLKYARQVCDSVNVPLEIVNMQKEYWDNVVSYTVAEAKAGRTPNPDVLCNQQIKFGQFYSKIDDSYEKVATGHYARVCENSKLKTLNSKQIPNSKSPISLRQDESCLYVLRTSPDSVKDQTYFLAHLSQEQLSRAIFPIGKYTKEEVRELAKKFDLPNKNRKDSQGICFLGKIPFREFLQHHLDKMPGDFINKETGEKVGEHFGYWFYTIGQRNGLGLSGGPWFVVEKDIKKNIVYLANGYEPESVYKNKFEVSDLHWISPVGTLHGMSLQVKIRHGAVSHACMLKIDGKKGYVELPEKVHGVAPGQFAVFYYDDLCLGCGMIS